MLAEVLIILTVILAGLLAGGLWFWLIRAMDRSMPLVAPAETDHDAETVPARRPPTSVSVPDLFR